MKEPLHADAVEFAAEQWSRAGLPHHESLQLMSSLTRAHQLMTARMEQALGPFDLNASRYLLLMSLMLAPSGAYRMSTLRWLLMLHHTTVTTLVDKLVRRGLVRRETDPGRPSLRIGRHHRSRPKGRGGGGRGRRTGQLRTP